MKPGSDGETTHYGAADDPYEVIKIIEYFRLGFHLGNTIKYILRAPFKGAPLKDLRKARWYLDRHIKNLENESCESSPNPE